MRKQFSAVTIGVLLILSVFAVLQWQIKPAQATTLFSDGFETGTFGAWTGTSGAPYPNDTAIKNSGSYGANATGTVVESYCYETITDQSPVYCREYVRFLTLPSSGNSLNFLMFYTTALASFWGQIGHNGTNAYWQISYRDGGGSIRGNTSNVVPSVDTWYCVEGKYVKNDAVGGASLFVDGVEVINSTGITTNNVDINSVRCGLSGTYPSSTLWWDDCEISTSYIGTLGDVTPPTFGTISANCTLAGNDTQISCTIEDGNSLSAWGFAWNNTGATVNASKIAVSGTSVTARFNGTWNETAGNKVWVEFWANDTTNNAAYSGAYTFTLGEESSGTYSYEIFVNATSTYRINSAGVIDASGASLTVINNAITATNTIGVGNSGIFIYNGTYQLAGTMNMKSNVNITLQDGCLLNETSLSSDTYIINFASITNASINANSNAVIHGSAANGQRGIMMSHCSGITIQASQPNGLTLYNIGHSWMEMSNVNDSVFQNLYGYNWMMSFQYAWHGILVDGLQNVQFINITSDGLNGDSRSALCIGGESYPVNNVNITGGLYENAYYDNGIYLGGWSNPVTNIRITNVTTYQNNAYHSGHSGLKIRPASYVTVTGWNSTNDYYGLEMGTCYNTEGALAGSHHNNITGTITNAYNSGIVITTDGNVDANQTVNDNFFNLTITTTTTGPAVYMSQGTTYDCANNTFYINASASYRSGVWMEAGNFSQNAFYANFSSCGTGGYADLLIASSSYINTNNFYVYATSGNPNGLLGGITNGTNSNYIYYPYSYSGPPPVLVTIDIISPTNTTYSSSTITVEIDVTVSGDTLDTVLWNLDNASSWVYVSNQTYTIATQMKGISNGEHYTLYVWANATDGTEEYATVMFSVSISAEGITQIIVNTWWSGFW